MIIQTDAIRRYAIRKGMRKGNEGKPEWALVAKLIIGVDRELA